MADAGAGRHPLRQARIQHAVVALAVGVLQASGYYPGDDLHVAVTVGSESLPARNDVVVVDQQQAVSLVLGCPVVAEVERVLRVEPTSICEEALVGAVDVDGAHDRLQHGCVRNNSR